MPLLEDLQQLGPLPKVHYSASLPAHMWEPGSRPLLTELARITQAVSIWAEWATKERVRVAAYVCKITDATIAINYMPWHRKFGKDLPPTDDGEPYRAELREFFDRLTQIRGWIDEYNAENDAAVAVSAVLFDSERFHTKTDDDKWNQAITDKYDAFTYLGKQIFPAAKIHWFGMGMEPSASSTGWSPSTWNPGNNILDAGSCSLYRVPEIGITRETFTRSLALAQERGLSEVTPWVALGSGWQRQVEAFKVFDHDWDYPLIYSWMLGAELNIDWYGARPERFLPGMSVGVVVFWPAPFDPRSPAWGKHLVAYVLGATGVRSLTVSEGG